MKLSSWVKNLGTFFSFIYIVILLPYLFKTEVFPNYVTYSDRMGLFYSRGTRTVTHPRLSQYFTTSIKMKNFSGLMISPCGRDRMGEHLRAHPGARSSLPGGVVPFAPVCLGIEAQVNK